MVGTLATVVLHSLGLAGPLPLLPLLAWGVVLLIIEQPEVQRWLSGGGRYRRRWLGLAIHLSVLATLVYAIGWGPLCPIAFLVAGSMQMRMHGSAAWRPAMLWSLISIAAGQAGIALGWVYCYLPATYAQAAGLLGALSVVLFLRELGQSMEQREKAESAVRASEERFRALVQDSDDVVAVMDQAGTIQYVRPAVFQITGLPPDRLAGTDFREWVHPDDLTSVTTLWGQALVDPGGQHLMEARARHTDGGWRWLEMTVRNLLDNPAVGGLVANYRDVTERRVIQERLIHEANHDPLTGLSNRASFLRGLELAYASASHATGAPAALFIDLDGFKEVNDTLGHRNGDALIVVVAGVLRRCVLGSDIVGRLGGDEFGVILTTINSPKDAVVVAKRILAQLDQVVLLEGHEVLARASIGVAVSGLGCRDAKSLLQHADTAMYSAKRRGSHGFQVHVPGGAEDTLVGVAGAR